MAKEKAPKPPSKKLRKEFFKAFADDNADAVAAHLDAGVDPSRMFQLDWEYPALASALERNRSPKIARLLLDRGVDVKVAGEKGNTALHHVYDRAFAKELLDRGADPNARDSYERTPLHAAATNKALGVVEELVARGAELDAVDKNGATAYALAHHYAIREHLRSHGAKAFGDGGGKVLSPAIEETPAQTIDVDRGAIGADREGNVWFAGYQGIFRYDGTKVTRFKFEETFAIGHVAAGPPGVVYFGTNWGLLRFASDEWRLYSTQDSELFDHHVTFMTTAPDGRAYMLSYESEVPDKHISIFDGERFTVLEPGKDYPLEMEIERVAFDARGEVMLCGQGGYAIKRDGAWHVVRKLEGAVFQSRVYDMLDDGEALWIGTQAGVYEQRGEQTTKHNVKNLAKYLLKDASTIWVGTYFGGLVRIRDGEIVVLDAKNSALPHDDVQGFARATDGTIWVHTSGGAAFLRGDELVRFPASEAVEPA
jgi:ligand-binding sensor domain-containing protein